MKNSIILSIFMSIFCSFKLYSQANGDFEYGNLTNWVVYTGTSTNPQNNSTFVINNDPQKFGIHQHIGPSSNFSLGIPMIVNGQDYYGGFDIPSEGSSCLRIGNNKYTGKAEAELVKFTFTVTQANKHFMFRYALVLNDPISGHTPEEKPEASMYIVKGDKISPVGLSDMLLYNRTLRHVVSNVKDPFFSISRKRSDVVYKPWQCVSYDLSDYVGKTVSFCMRVRGCTQTAHFGYAYLDGLNVPMVAQAAFTLPKNTFCPEEAIVMNPSASTGEDSYFVEVREDGSNNSVINEWFTNQPAPSAFDLKAFMLKYGKTFECGKSYWIKVAVASECAPWNETSSKIQIVCPSINAGPDLNFCCGVGSSVKIGEAAQSGCTYSWTSIPSGFVSSIAKPTIYLSNSSSRSYFVTKKDAFGCTAKDEVIVRIEPKFTLSLTKLPYKECGNSTRVSATLSQVGCIENPEFSKLHPQADASLINWYFISNGSTVKTYVGKGENIVAPNIADGVLYAEYQTSCSSTILRASMNITYNPVTNNHNLIAPNGFMPSNTNVNAVFRIQETGPLAPMNIGDGPAYDASDFNLRIWNRWGENILTIDKNYIGRTGALMQGDIKWDGKIGGVLQQAGLYVYTLDMKYCGSTNFVNVPTPNDPTLNPCVSKVLWWCTKKINGYVSRVTIVL